VVVSSKEQGFVEAIQNEILSNSFLVSETFTEQELIKTLKEKSGFDDDTVLSLVDDVFDMAKALVTALTYGMQQRSPSQGRINNIEKLLTALINGRTIGPATAIGNDYRVLEQQRVIKLTHHENNMFYMKLLKKEVGQLALNVLSNGNIGPNSAELMIPIASMNLYHGPEFERERTRRKQSKPSKQHTNDILTALRGLKEI